jgi:multisubunit Na+/H+ antiporter MnhE subunit
MYANSITMTPGTVTAYIDEKKRQIIVHAITKKTADDIKSGAMAKKVGEVLV